MWAQALLIPMNCCSGRPFQVKPVFKLIVLALLYRCPCLTILVERGGLRPDVPSLHRDVTSGATIVQLEGADDAVGMLTGRGHLPHYVVFVGNGSVLCGGQLTEKHTHIQRDV